MDETRYMKRALQLARKGMPYAFPNPMVGAVITDSCGNIIGEGYHRKCGEAHAEVNAIASVADERQLAKSTMYVTLEPCAHYGRTGPCAKLIIDKGIRNVVVGTRDPFDKVDGKGIEMLREAGVDVTVGMFEKECQSLNAIFFTAHTLHRPFVILKWARSSDGYLDVARSQAEPPEKISCQLTSTLTHQLRAICDGILVGSNTVIQDDPTLNTRLWPGKSPRPIILDRRHRITGDYKILSRDPVIISDYAPLSDILHRLYVDGFTSILVEGGAEILNAFLTQGLWDMARVETGPIDFGEYGRVRAPYITDQYLLKTSDIEGHTVKYYSKNALIDVKNL